MTTERKASRFASVIALLLFSQGGSAQTDSPAQGVRGAVKLEKADRLSVPAKGVLPVIKSGTVSAGLVLTENGVGKLDRQNALKISYGPTEPDSRVVQHVGQYLTNIGIHRLSGYQKSRMAHSRSDYLILDPAGTKLLELKKVNPGLQPQPSPSGDYVVAAAREIGHSPPYFIDSKGLRNKWVETPGQSEWPSGHEVSHMYFSADGSRVAIIGERGSFQTICFDAHGKKLWGMAGNGVVIFPRNNSGAIVILDSKVISLTANGTVAKEVAIPGLGAWSDGAVSADGTLAVVSTRDQIMLVDMSRAEVRWKKTLDDFGTLRGVIATRKVTLNGLHGSDDLRSIVATALVTRTKVLQRPDGSPAEIPELESSHALVLTSGGDVLDEILLPGNAFILSGRNEAMFDVSRDGHRLVLPGPGGVLTYAIPASR